MEADLHRRAIADDDVMAIWERRAPRSTAHRGYIFIDEEDIIDATELPLYTIEASRYGALRRLERMVGDDLGRTRRIEELAPELARETVALQRANWAFFTRRPGVSNDVPATPDLMGPLFSFPRKRH